MLSDSFTTAACCIIKFKRSVNNSAVIEQFFFKKKKKASPHLMIGRGGRKQEAIVKSVTKVTPFLKNLI